MMKQSARHMAKENGEEDNLAEVTPEEAAEAEEVVERVLGRAALGTITPEPGFVVKAVRKFGRGKFMVNCCAHHAVQPPLEPRFPARARKRERERLAKIPPWKKS